MSKSVSNTGSIAKRRDCPETEVPWFQDWCGWSAAEVSLSRTLNFFELHGQCSVALPAFCPVAWREATKTTTTTKETLPMGDIGDWCNAVSLTTLESTMVLRSIFYMLTFSWSLRAKFMFVGYTDKTAWKTNNETVFLNYVIWGYLKIPRTQHFLR